MGIIVTFSKAAGLVSGERWSTLKTIASLIVWTELWFGSDSFLIGLDFQSIKGKLWLHPTGGHWAKICFICTLTVVPFHLTVLWEDTLCQGAEASHGLPHSPNHIKALYIPQSPEGGHSGALADVHLPISLRTTSALHLANNRVVSASWKQQLQTLDPHLIRLSHKSLAHAGESPDLSALILGQGTRTAVIVQECCRAIRREACLACACDLFSEIFLEWTKM